MTSLALTDRFREQRGIREEGESLPENPIPLPTEAVTTVWVLGDQLNLGISSLRGLIPDRCVVLMVESLSSARRLPYHKQKLVLVWSAMRHFAHELRQNGYTVDYHPLQEEPVAAITRHLSKFKPCRVRIMETAEYGRSERLARLVRRHAVLVEVTPNNMFLSDKAEFRQWVTGKDNLVMESFYRNMRRKTGLLMQDGKPEGDQWNFDQLNRQRPPKDHSFPEILRFDPDEITQEVMDLVDQFFPDNFGELAEFSWPVTRGGAQRFLDDFLGHRLDLFGPYEDAMVQGKRALYHSLLSPLLNLGLMDPLAVCEQAVDRYREGQARLQSVEGFIRQIIGWREFIYQVYHLQMPSYQQCNHLDAALPLPDFYWTGETKMGCVRDAVKSLRTYGANHHIQRLMVTGNFALIAGIDPQQVNEWYRLAYADAYDWVVTPNVLGMALYADGGLLATKPYAASANYINRMSNYCGDCYYSPKQVIGGKACPFNSLYWDFLARNQKLLEANPRMNLVMANLRGRDPDTIKEIRDQASRIRNKLRRGDFL